jgi:LPXTG-motif cell wall-anchored protein
MLLLLPVAVQAMVNPAAAYCTALGYSYSSSPDAAGNAVGTCMLANGQSVDAWQFLLGQQAQESGFCARNGYQTRVVNDTKACEIYNKPSCAACVFQNGSAIEVTRMMDLDFREIMCNDNGCRDPKDYPLPPPYVIPPSGGSGTGPALSGLTILLVIVIVLVIAGAGWYFLKKKKSP